jgi:hypothetical protein
MTHRPNMFEFVRELTKLINRYGLENEANISDYQIAEHLAFCFHALNRAVQARDAWYGMNPEPGTDWAKRVPEPPRSRQIEVLER